MCSLPRLSGDNELTDIVLHGMTQTHGNPIDSYLPD